MELQSDEPIVKALEPDRQPTRLAGRRVTVMGLGRFGGGTGVTRWLVEQDASVLVTDVLHEKDLREPLAPLEDFRSSGRIELRLGGHDEHDFSSCDLVVANPAVPKPWANPFLVRARAAGIPITTEINLLVERLDRRQVIGVTGTAGKSTTTAMIQHVLASCCCERKAWLGGNIGGSLLADLDRIAPDDLVVLELSSAMLHWLGAGERAGWSPHWALLTNLAPNHLDWHGDFDHYRRSKEGIFRHQEPGDRALRGVDIRLDGPRIPLGLPGTHNQHNACVAARVAAEVAGIGIDDARMRLADFTGLPHRLQLVAERDGMRFYNDSKSTTPEATCLAVAAFEHPRHIHLIAGGHDKGADLTSIAQLAKRIGGLYTIGATGAALAADVPNPSHVERCATLDKAVRAARERMREGDVLVLSPGCASWDQFANYEERGARFTALVAYS